MIAQRPTTRMFTRPSVLAWAMFAATPGVHGCGGDPDGLPPVQWHGQRVSFGTDIVVDEVCQGTLAMLDRGVEQIESVLELPSNNERITVYVVSDAVLAEQCKLGHASGCARRNRVFLKSYFDYSYLHELTHTRLFQIMGYSKPFFEEGIASALGGGPAACLSYADCTGADLDRFLVAPDVASLGFVGYAAGGDLVHGMLTDYGPDDVLAFIAELGDDAPADLVRSAYQARFGASLDEDFLRFRRSPLDEFTPMQLKFIAPEAPRTGSDGGVILQASMDCASPRVVNDFSAAVQGEGSNQGLVEWTFEVTPEQAGFFGLKGVVAETGTLAVLLRTVESFRPWHLSDRGPFVSGGLVPSKHTENGHVLLGPGLYRIVWKHALDPNAKLDVVFAPSCTFENQDCPEGQQCTIWNECVEQVAQPATLGEPCTEVMDGPRACEAGTRCLGGVCTAECDATKPAGEACARQRVCGPVCDLLGDECAPGMSCLPTSDTELTAVGRGQCIAAGTAEFLEACRRRESDCGEGLSCESAVGGKCDPGEFDGCCTFLCDPAAADPSCPEEQSHCDWLQDRPVGVCRPDTGQNLSRLP